MSGPTFTLPPQIVDMLVRGLCEMDNPPKHTLYEFWHRDRAPEGQIKWVKLTTDAGDVLTFERGPDMERT